MRLCTLLALSLLATGSALAADTGKTYSISDSSAPGPFKLARHGNHGGHSMPGASHGGPDYRSGYYGGLQNPGYNVPANMDRPVYEYRPYHYYSPYYLRSPYYYSYSPWYGRYYGGEYLSHENP